MAPVTRHVARTTGQPLQPPLQPVRRAQQPAGIQRPQRPKPYHCLICDKTFGSKNWVARHFYRSHNVPYIDRAENPDTGRPAYREYMPAYTHPSCWTAENTTIDRIREITQLKQNAHMTLRSSASTTEQIEHDVAYAMQQVGALNEEELVIKKKNKKLSMWLWWWNTQLGDVTELAEPARGAGINVLGDSGEQSLEMQGWETAYNPVEVGDPSLYESGGSSVAIEENTGYDELSTNPTNRASRSRRANNAVNGPEPGAFDLATNFLQGQVTKEAAIHFLSDVNIGFVERQSEGFNTGTTMANAALSYVQAIAQDQALIQDCQDRVAARHLRNATAGSIEAQHEDLDQFRLHRQHFIAIMKRATRQFFIANPNGSDENRLLRRLRIYAQMLSDERAAAEANSCLNANEVLLRQLIEEKEEWRQGVV